MKIRNDLISIKIGKKQYDFNNLILDTYLQRFIKGQLDKDYLTSVLNDKELRYCLFKFDTPLENLEGNISLKNKDFDICFVFSSKSNQIVNDKQISIQYDYKINNDVVIIDYNKPDNQNIKISDYYNKKITAIGFNSFFADDTNFSYKVPVCAVLDTSNYNIYLQENQELAITRKDIITTDALFYSNNKDKVPGPVHLAPLGVPQIIYQPPIYSADSNSWRSFNDPGYGILYSIGLSSYTDYIDKEFLIGKDVEVEENGTELNIKGLENYLVTDNSLFPSNNIYPSAGLYPVKTNYKYVILKYKVWQNVNSGDYDNIVTTLTDTGYYYYQAVPIDKFGELDLKIKYERG